MMAIRPFLHGIDMQVGQVSLLWTTAQRLRKAAFVDGRSALSRRPADLMPLQEFLQREREAAPAPRFIFHIGFCGSTLLSRLLDVAGQTLVLREPNCLADIANAKAQLGSHPLLFQMAQAASRHLARPWRAGELVVVKPSNWVNNILPMLTSQPGVKAVVISSSRREFLEAVLRGGPERIAFAARAAIHLSSEGPEPARMVAAALKADEDQSAQLARLALALHAIQLRALRAAAEQAEWRERIWLDYSHLAADPFDVVQCAAEALDLAIGPAAISANIKRWMARDAKDPEAAFSSSRNAELAAAVHARHGATIERALDWAEPILRVDQGS